MINPPVKPTGIYETFVSKKFIFLFESLKTQIETMEDRSMSANEFLKFLFEVSKKFVEMPMSQLSTGSAAVENFNIILNLARQNNWFYMMNSLCVVIMDIQHILDSEGSLPELNHLALSKLSHEDALVKAFMYYLDLDEYEFNYHQIQQGKILHVVFRRILDLLNAERIFLRQNKNLDKDQIDEFIQISKKYVIEFRNFCLSKIDKNFEQ